MTPSRSKTASYGSPGQTPPPVAGPEASSPDREFPVRIGRRLTLVAALFVTAVLVVGGVSLTLASRIFENNEVVARDYGHIMVLDQVHGALHALVSDVSQMSSSGRRNHTNNALRMSAELDHGIDRLADLQGADPEERAHVASMVREMRTVAAGLHAAAERMVLSPEPLTAADGAMLARANLVVPERLAELADLDRARISHMLEGSRKAIRAIVQLYLAFLVVGLSLVAGARVAFDRGIALPLRELAQAAGLIASGAREARVEFRSRTEIGRLAHAFNSMAERLELHGRELEAVHTELERKAREAEALYRIGTEVARLHEPDRILATIVERARELLGGDAAALCLHTAVRGEVAVRATSGPGEAFLFAATSRASALRIGSAHELPCAVIREEYAGAHLVAPLSLDADPIGALCVSTREPREWSTDEVELLGSLASQAAIAIERVRLAGELRGLAASEERERLAREMHDGLAQALGLLNLKLQLALRARGEGDPEQARAALQEMSRITAGAYDELRQAIFGLRTIVSRRLGLVPTLTEYLHEYSVQTGIAVDFQAAEDTPAHLPPAAEVQAVRIIQEALANVRKHAGTDKARVRISRDGLWLQIAVEDDGVGWDRAQAAAKGRLHFGLQTMRERAEGIGGTFEIETAPGRGTHVLAMIPAGEPA